MPRFRFVAWAVLTLTAACHAQWDPDHGLWSKSDIADLRVMTWNTQDGLCSSNAKVEGYNDWCALARIVAAMKPDMLILQECGDNNGEGTGNGVDSPDTLSAVLGLFLHGGKDPYHGNAQVTAYIQKYAPDFDLPYRFVSAQTDGYNRNVILSRYPFKDLNGDGKPTLSDIQTVSADLYAPGGNGQIRGFAWAEIDLPDSLYGGDLVLGTAHLKSGDTQSDLAQRLKAAQNVAYYVDYMFNGAGTGSPDPRGKIADSPNITRVLGARTPLIWGGDFNEDELANNRRGPAEWLTQASLAGGADGADRDRTDAGFDDARELFTGSRSTWGSSKLDYLCWQDSIATLRRAWIFDSGLTDAQMPAELKGYAGGAWQTTHMASDHRPVIADFALPRPLLNAHRKP